MKQVNCTDIMVPKFLKHAWGQNVLSESESYSFTTCSYGDVSDDANNNLAVQIPAMALGSQEVKSYKVDIPEIQKLCSYNERKEINK